ncbi:MAG: hypothetical protein WD071_07370 [Pseudohongiella sp.]|uniref:hypothetical protein n=1 Tax=Pseudohongiella sp. TaxID=1979412 RepID=UPI00349FDAB5
MSKFFIAPILFVLNIFFSIHVYGQPGAFETSVVDENGVVHPIQISQETIARAIVSNHDALLSAQVLAIRDPDFDSPVLESRLIELELKVIKWYKTLEQSASETNVTVLVNSDLLAMPGKRHSRQREKHGVTNIGPGTAIHGESFPDNGAVILPNESYLMGFRNFNGKLRLPTNPESLHWGDEMKALETALDNLNLN